MKLYFPPLAQFIVYGLLGYLASRAMPSLGYTASIAVWIALVMFGLGAIILFQAVRLFGKAETTVNPIEPEKAERLVTSGLYRFTRNPMYLGMLLVLLGGALYLQNIAALSGPLAYMLSMTFLQIKPEERVLSAKFGKPFEDYCQRTRRWF